MERDFRQIIKEIVHYKRNVKASKEIELCYPGETDGHFQIPVDVYVADLKETLDNSPKEGL